MALWTFEEHPQPLKVTTKYLFLNTYLNTLVPNTSTYTSRYQFCPIIILKSLM